MFERHDHIREPLHVITTVFNPVRYRSRWRLYEDFARMVQRSGAILHTVEVSFGERSAVLNPFDPKNAVPEPEYDREGNYIALRTRDELWLKENAINLGFARLPADWKYAAWIDADILFARGDWANETVQQLQHHPVLQMWTESVDLSPDYEILRRFRSFAWCMKNDTPIDISGNYYYYDAFKSQEHYWHPGFAWAIRRDAFDALGGLVDWSILGSGDFFMANALAGRIVPASKQLGEAGSRWLENWKDRADRYVRQNVGYVDGLILHFWHGKKANRRYKDRWKILVDAGFNAEVDLYRDWQGLWQLNPDNKALRDGIRDYFRQRNEDGTDL